MTEQHDKTTAHGASSRPIGIPSSEWARGERATLIVLGVAALVLRVALIPFYGYSDDEPQHLHVAWAWSKGLVQYRDVFDNHVPLFHLIMAPLVGLIGEKPWILVFMRATMLPFLGILAWCFYDLLRRLFDKRLAIWGVILLCSLPIFFLPSIEFRTDVPWAMTWMLALWTLLGGQWSLRRALAGGLLLGVAFCTSMKTVIMLATLASAWTALVVVDGPYRRGLTLRGVAGSAAALLGGVAMPLLLLAAFIHWLGIWREFYYCTVLHNVFPGMNTSPLFVMKNLPSLLFFILLAGCALLERGQEPGQHVRHRRSFLWMTAAFATLLLLVWPVGQIQTFIPFIPLIAWVLIAAPRLPIWPWTRPSRGAWRGWGRSRKIGFWAYAAFAIVGLRQDVHYAQPWQPHDFASVRFYRQVLRLTDPSDYVMDAKGETVFRRRPYYYVLEKFTIRRLKMKLLPDDIVQRCIDARACVVINFPSQLRRFPAGDRAFFMKNYLDVGFLRVVGRFLKSPASGDPRVQSFDIVIPQRYVFITPDGPAAGKIDGVPYRQAVMLRPGRHVFTSDRKGAHVAVAWAQAIERGFQPAAWKK
jgi:hypothetical protein